MKRVLVIAFHVLLAVLALTLAVLQTLVVQQVYHPPRATHIGLAIAVGSLTFLDRIVALIVSRKRAGDATKRGRIEKVAVAALLSIDATSVAGIRSLGVSVFRCRRRVFLKSVEDRVGVKISVPWIRQELFNVARFRLEDHPQPSTLRWTAGKGAIGRCWELRAQVHADIREAAQLPDLSESQFEQLDQAVRSGFSFAEFVQVRTKYSEVLATPIKAQTSSNTVLGVISIDRPATEDSLATLALDTIDVRQFAAHAAAMICDDL